MVHPRECVLTLKKKWYFHKYYRKPTVGRHHCSHQHQPSLNSKRGSSSTFKEQCPQSLSDPHYFHWTVFYVYSKWFHPVFFHRWLWSSGNVCPKHPRVYGRPTCPSLPCVLVTEAAPCFRGWFDPLHLPIVELQTCGPCLSLYTF